MTATFFTVADARYFLGVAALVNSLRVVGHTDEVVVLDGGFTREQVAALSATCTVIPLPAEYHGAANPTYYKLVAPRALGVDDVAVIIDSDMLVTSSLQPLIDLAEEGYIVGYPDPEDERWFAEWSEIFELPGVPRQQTYVNAGLVVFSGRHHPRLVEEWWEACARISSHPTVAEGATGPTSQADQDALNAILMTRYPAERIAFRPADEAPQAQALREGVDIVDRRTLACRYNGTPTTVLHAASKPKPWITTRGANRTAYLELMADVLSRPDAAVHVPARSIPPFLRGGPTGRTVRSLVFAVRYAVRRAYGLAGTLRRTLRLPVS